MWATLWQSITELEFITVFFTWLFMAASRLAEPLMSIAAIYSILCAGIPAWKVQSLYNGGMAVMIASPEIILPGAFVLAGHARDRQDPKAWMLQGVAWALVALTFFTLADLFLFHLSGTALSVLLWGRCVVGISYSILLRVLTHAPPRHEGPGRAARPEPPVDASQLAHALVPLLAPHLRELGATLLAEIQPVLAPPLDAQERGQHLVPLLEATLVRESTATVALLAGPPAAPHREARVTCHGAVVQDSAEGQSGARVTGPLQKATQHGEAEATDDKLEAAYQHLRAQGGRISGRALAPLARVNKSTAAKWLRATHPEASSQGQQDGEPRSGEPDEARTEDQG